VHRRVLRERRAVGRGGRHPIDLVDFHPITSIASAIGTIPDPNASIPEPITT
jgi:hypothetical protein